LYLKNQLDFGRGKACRKNLKKARIGAVDRSSRARKIAPSQPTQKACDSASQSASADNSPAAQEA
jgi:hypothetical protein